MKIKICYKYTGFDSNDFIRANGNLKVSSFSKKKKKKKKKR